MTTRNTEIRERLATLETRVVHIEAQQSQAIKQAQERDKVMMEKLNAVLSEFGRYKGFFGGCVFILSAIWAFFKLVGAGFLAGLLPGK